MNYTGSYRKALKKTKKKTSSNVLFSCRQGPKGEAVGSITQPLPSSHLIFRAASESDGKRPALNYPSDIHVSRLETSILLCCVCTVEYVSVYRL